MKPEVIQQIIKELEQRQKDFESPSSYMEDEYYLICRAKASAFEEAILIIKNLVK
jgi:hypothetical protein